MSITVKANVYHEHLALVPTLQQLEDVNIQVITHVNTDPGSNTFPFLIEYHDQAELEAALDADPTIEAYDLVDRNNDTGIYYIEHTEEAKLISSIVTSVNGFVVHTETKDRGWFVQLHLPDRQALSTIWEYAETQGIRIDIIEIYGDSGTDVDASYGLTEPQREALIVAFRNGYFDEPREMSLNEVAEEIGLSSTAMSGRMRRGMRNLISAALEDEESS
ncbi:MAG: helix-turn-helix domain-containing protein [Natronomonas sp.]